MNLNHRRSPLPFLPVFPSISITVLGALLLLAGVPAATAQVDRAVLEGTVTDPSGRVVSGATVKVLAVDTGLSAELPANANGYYRFPGLAVGRYTVTALSPGFKTKVVEDVVLLIGQTHTLDVQLAVGTIDEKVEVHATELADRTTAEAATVIDTTQIADLPNNGRDWSSFTLLAPFAQDDGGGDQRTIRFAGRARDDNNFSIDGVDAGGIQEQAQKSQTRLQISQDAIEEYRVNSALYDVEYGTQAGGQIDVETKHGTNEYHGTVFGYFRNSVFDARNFNDYNLEQQPAIPPFRLGQYGLTFGGPIKKDNTFIFLSYEGIRQLQSTTESGVYVPAGVCCASFQAPEPQNVTVPYQQYVLDQATSLGYGPQVCQIMQGYAWRASVGSIDGCSPRFVLPDSAFQYMGGGGNANQDELTFVAPTIVHEDTWLVRIDHKIGANTMLYGRAQRDISLVDAPNGNSSLATDKIQTINHPANYELALQHTFRPTLFNEVKFYVNRAPFHNPQASALPYGVNTPDFVALNNDSADIEVGSTYGLIDNMIWSRGRHTFKVGMEYRRVRLNQGQTSNNNLTFGDDYSLSQASLTNINYIAPWCCHRLRRNFLMPYFQDEWKATPTVTLTAGLRWDYYGVAHEATNRTTVFDVNTFHGVCLGTGSFNVPPVSSTLGPLNTPPCPANPALYNASYVNFDPRLALAWAPAALHGKTVIRTGFGIYHGAAQNDDLNAGLESDTFRVLVNNFGACNPIPPQTFCPNLQTQFEQLDPTFTGVSGIGKTANHPRALQREGRRDLYVESWTLSLEHQLPDNFIAGAQYLGSRGLRLFSRGAVNLCNSPVVTNVLPGNPTVSPTDCQRPLDAYYAPDPSTPGITTSDPFGSVDYKHDVGSSTYNGLALSLERNFKEGLELQARYTWSHSINDGSVGGGESNGPENVNCLQCDKGPSVFDIRNNVAVNAVYELPFGPGKPYVNSPGILGTIVEGWQLSSIGLWHTGHPLTVGMDLSANSISDPTATFVGFPFTYILPNGDDQDSQRPDIIPGVPLTLPHQHPAVGGAAGSPYINAAAFAPPPVDANGNFTRFGNEPNGAIRALPYWQIDLALTKETKLTEHTSLEFAVQAFNIFNHVQFADPSQLNLAYDTPTQVKTAGVLTPESGFGYIDTTVNFNINNDNAASPNTGTGLPRQLQFMVRFKF